MARTIGPIAIFKPIQVGHGGARPGAGRKPGQANQKTREIADRAAREGITPLEVMLRAMREHVAHSDELRREADEVDIKLLTGERDDSDTPAKLRRGALTAITEAASMAKDAAPYMHPRLANVISTVDAEVRQKVQIVSEFGDA